jgi:ribose transport system substrate-binding protein
MSMARWTRTAGILGLALAVGGIGAIGCSKEAQSPGGSSAAPAKAAGLKIALIAKSSTNPVFLSARTGAEAAAKELSQKHNVPVEIVWLTPPAEDGQVQAQRIAQAVNEGASAILISCSDAGKVNGAINDAVGRGVQVMTFDSDAPDSKRFAFYGVDDVKTGQAVMDELAKQMGEKGNIAILAGNQNAPNLRKRVEGVKDAAKKYPNMKVVETFYHIETPQDAAAEVVRAQNAYPQIQGWAMIGGWPLFTQTLLTDLDPKKVKIVAVDGLPAELPYVEKGLAPVLLAQPTYQWGYVSVNRIFEKVQLKQDGPAIMPMELVRVSKDNLGTWARQLKEWGFTDVDEKYLKLP